MHSDITYTRPIDRQQSTTLFATNGHAVADIRTDADGIRYLTKTIQGSKHALRMPPALAIDVAIIEDARSQGCSYVVIKDREAKILYRADMAVIAAHGFNVSRGCGRQTALAYAFWDERDYSGNLLKRGRQSQVVSAPSLFGGEAA